MFNSFLKSLIGIVVVGLSIYLSVFVYTNIKPTSTVLHYPSALLVMGCLIGISFFLVDFIDYGRFFGFFFAYSVTREKQRTFFSETIFEEMLNLYLKEGPQSFTQYVKSHNLPHIWQIVATKLEIKVPIDDIKTILDYKIRKIVGKLDYDISVVRQLAVLAPSFGLLGTVIGLIKMLLNMNDFNSLGANMALALITTLYGIIIGNLFFIPIAVQIEKRKDMSIKNHENIDYWLSTLEDKKPSFYLKNKLRDLTKED